MEKDLPVPKPGDLFIGVIDLFAVLVPGVIAITLIVWAGGKDLPEGFAAVFGFLAAGWIVGHVLHGIGSWLDVLVYDPLFKMRKNERTGKGSHGRVWKYLHQNHALQRLALRMTNVPLQPKTEDGAVDVVGGMYQWSRAWLDSNSPESTTAVDRLEADSKLFRSLAVLLVVLLFVPFVVPQKLIKSGDCRWALYDHRLSFVLFTGAGMIFSLWRYCDLRNKTIRRCYLSYVQGRSERGDDAAHSQRAAGPG